MRVSSAPDKDQSWPWAKEAQSVRCTAPVACYKDKQMHPAMSIFLFYWCFFDHLMFNFKNNSVSSMLYNLLNFSSLIIILSVIKTTYLCVLMCARTIWGVLTFIMTTSWSGLDNMWDHLAACVSILSPCSHITALWWTMKEMMNCENKISTLSFCLDVIV